jgi:chromosome segregation ATPase
LEFAPEVPPQARLTELVQTVTERLESADQKSKTDARRIQDLQEQTAVLKGKLKEANETVASQAEANSELTRTMERYQTKAESMISPTKHADLEAKYKRKLAEYREMEQQIEDLKAELKRVLDGLDGRTEQQMDLEANLQEAADLNEELKLRLVSTERELEAAQIGLRDCSREILALERRLIKQRTQVVVVKDPIPTGTMPPLARRPRETEIPKADFYVSESVKQSLAAMQTRMMKQEAFV